MRTNWPRLFLLIVLWLTTTPIGGAELAFRHRGLEELRVEALLQGRQGYIWMGTNEGLQRFDGYRFRSYTHDPDDPESLCDDLVHVLHEDRGGRLWVGTSRGLSRYDEQSGGFVSFLHDPADPRSLSDDTVLALAEDAEGTLWVGTEQGLNRLDVAGDGFRRYLHDDPGSDSRASGRVLAISPGAGRRLWIGTPGGLLSLDTATDAFTRYFHDPDDSRSLSHDLVRALFLDQKGRLWVGTYGGGLDRLDRPDAGFVHHRHDATDPGSLGGDAVAAILEDSRGNLLVGTDGGGLSVRAPGADRFTRHAHDPLERTSLATDVVLSIMEDDRGDLWVGHHDGGVQYLDRSETGFTHLGRDPSGAGLLHSSVLSLAEDADGTLWVGTESGLNRLDPDTRRFRYYIHEPAVAGSLSANAVLAIERDHLGVLWVGTFFGGLDRLDEATGRFLHHRNDPANPLSLSNDHVWDILDDSQGELWVATLDGLNRLDRSSGAFRRHWPDDGVSSLSHRSVWVLFEDRERRLWVGTDRGLDRYDRRTGEFVRHPDLTRKAVLSLHQDSGGQLWIGTRGDGLLQLDPETGSFTRYRGRDGLPNDVINTILEDERGMLWLSTNAGLSRFDPGAGSFRNYGRYSGLRGERFAQDAGLRSRTGELLFGAVHGLNRFLPGRLEYNRFVPPIVITDFRVFNEPFPIVSPAAQPGQQSDLPPITLTHDRSVLSFEFAALSYRNPESNRYAYMLEGFDHGWVDAGSRRSMTYTNLDPGRYVFRVRGSNDSGVWNEQGTSIALVIQPPFWTTWWFRVLVILGLAGVVVASHQLRVRSIRTRNALLQKEIDERRRVEAALEASNRELKRFNETVSHDLKSPLVTVRGFVGLVRTSLDQGEIDRARTDLERIGGAAERMSNLVEVLLDLSQAGKAVDEPRAVALGELAGEVLELLEGELRGRAVEVTIAPDLPVVQGDPIRLREVLQNLVDNAVKFMGDQPAPHIEIDARVEADEVLCVVRDNGLGIEPDQQHRVFGLFERASLASQGSGLGLALVKRVVEAHGGRVWVESVGQGKGSTFCFTLPHRLQPSPR